MRGLYAYFEVGIAHFIHGFYFLQVFNLVQSDTATVLLWDNKERCCMSVQGSGF